jgi:hypothetical protein
MVSIESASLTLQGTHDLYFAVEASRLTFAIVSRPREAMNRKFWRVSQFISQNAEYCDVGERHEARGERRCGETASENSKRSFRNTDEHGNRAGREVGHIARCNSIQ